MTACRRKRFLLSAVKIAQINYDIIIELIDTLKLKLQSGEYRVRSHFENRQANCREKRQNMTEENFMNINICPDKVEKKQHSEGSVSTNGY